MCFFCFFPSKEQNKTKKNSPFSLFLFPPFQPPQSPKKANSTSATFLRVVGSELIQKYLGDGPKLVRELFKAADEMAPSIVFIDEVDAIGTKRYDSQSGGEREIQRTMLEVRRVFSPLFFLGERESFWCCCEIVCCVRERERRNERERESESGRKD